MKWIYEQRWQDYRGSLRVLIWVNGLYLSKILELLSHSPHKQKQKPQAYVPHKFKLLVQINEPFRKNKLKLISTTCFSQRSKWQTEYFQTVCVMDANRLFSKPCKHFSSTAASLLDLSNHQLVQKNTMQKTALYADKNLHFMQRCALSGPSHTAFILQRQKKKTLSTVCVSLSWQTKNITLVSAGKLGV